MKNLKTKVRYEVWARTSNEIISLSIHQEMCSTDIISLPIEEQIWDNLGLIVLNQIKTSKYKIKQLVFIL